MIYDFNLCLVHHARLFRYAHLKITHPVAAGLRIFSLRKPRIRTL